MSSSLWTTIGMGINGTGTVPKARYPKGSGGAGPPSHAGMCSGACSVCCLSLLNSLRTQQGMPLMDQLERHGGLFLDSASTLFFEASRFGSGELPEDNSSSAAASLSSNRIGSLPLFCLDGGAGWPLPRTFSTRSPSRRVRKVFLLQMISTALQFGHLSGMFLLLRLHVLASTKELIFEGRVCWVVGHDDKVRWSGGLIGNCQSFKG